jgi:hypothetical protein
MFWDGDMHPFLVQGSRFLINLVRTEFGADVAPLAQLLVYGNHDINQFSFSDGILNNLSPRD